MAEVTFLGACGTVTGSCTLLDGATAASSSTAASSRAASELEQRNRRALPLRARGDRRGGAHPRPPRPHRPAAPAGRRGLPRARSTAPGRRRALAAPGARGRRPSCRRKRPASRAKKGYTPPRRSRGRSSPKRDARQALELLEPRRLRRRARDRSPASRLRFGAPATCSAPPPSRSTAKGGDGERRSWCFSGDVGRYGVPILRDPEPPRARARRRCCSSRPTATARTPHERSAEPRSAAIIERDLRARRRACSIPAFALGRTQDVLYHLSALADAGRARSRARLPRQPDGDLAPPSSTARPRASTTRSCAALVRRGTNPLALDRFRPLPHARRVEGAQRAPTAGW